MTDQTPGCGASSDARKRRTEAHQIHWDPAVCDLVAREVAAERERVLCAVGDYADELAADNIVTPASRYTRDVVVRELRALVSAAREPKP